MEDRDYHLFFVPDKQPLVAAPYYAIALEAASRPVGLWRAMLLGQGKDTHIAGPAGRS
jgi:hypothetical protein